MADLIAIVGISCRFAGANNLAQFWDLLVKSDDPIKTIPRWNPKEFPEIATREGGFLEQVDQFDANFFGISPNEAEKMDPQQRLLLELTWEALEQGGIPLRKIQKDKTGIFIGVSYNDYGILLKEAELLDPYQLSGNLLSATAGRLAYFLGVHGPALAIDTATSSSLVAIHQACQELRYGNCKYAVAGGINLILSPQNHKSLSKAHVLAPDGRCKTFDSSANGYGRSEGCGIVILKRLEDALQEGDPVLAVIRSSAVNQDGASNHLLAPNQEAQESLLQEALSKSELATKDIDYIETHGTGTPLGDVVETLAIEKVFQKQNLWIGSVKSNIGHCEAAAGIAGLAKVILSLQKEKIPKNLHLKERNPKIPAPLQIVSDSHLEWKKRDNHIRRAGISSFGFTGTNAHLIVEEPPSHPTVEEKLPLSLLVLSAKTEPALEALIQDYIQFLSSTDESLQNIAYTSLKGREHFPVRIAFVAKDIPEAIQKLKTKEYRQKTVYTSPFAHLTFQDLSKELDWNTLLNSLSEWYLQGIQIEWDSLQIPGKIVSIPTYSFQRETFWIPQEKKKVSSLQEMYTKVLPHERSTWLKNYLQKEVQEALGVSSIDIEKGFFDLGMTSLDSIEIRQKIQSMLGEEEQLSETLLLDYPNITALADYLETKLKSEAPTVKIVEVAKQNEEEDIAIIGIGCRLPGDIRDTEAYWELLNEGRDAIQEIPKDRWDIDEYYDPDPDSPGKMATRFGGFVKDLDLFDSDFFGISPKEAEGLDPQQRMVLESTWEALERASIAPTSLKGSSTGVFVGVSNTDYMGLLIKTEGVQTPYLATGNALSALSGRVSYILGLQGPALSLDTACSSSLVAIHEACKSLRLGECQLAIAGGVNCVLLPEMTINYSRAHMLAPDGRCKTFDAKADGYVRSEGCGILILKRLSEAIQNGDPILATIKGTSVDQDGSSGGLTIPNRVSQARLLTQALRNSKLNADEIQYIEAHGTGTSLGDPIEMGAIHDVYANERTSQNPLIVGSVKTNIGHLESAAGVAGVIKVILALQNGTIPKHLHFHKLNPKIHVGHLPLVIPTETIPWPEAQSKYAGVSSFGFTGTNSHVILGEGQQLNKIHNEIERPLHILTLSAKTEKALKETIKNYQDLLAYKPDLDLADVAYSANTGRVHYEYRFTAIGENIEQILSALQENPITKTEDTPSKIAFLFQGEEFECAEIYNSQPVFKNAYDRCSPISKPFAAEYALYELWKSWGIKPDYLLGIKMGQYVAAVAAHIIHLEEALQLVELDLSGNKKGFQEFAESISYQVPQAGFISKVSGEIVGPESLSGNYWSEKSVIDLDQGLEKLKDQGCNIFLEMKATKWKDLLELLSNLYRKGVRVDWIGFDQPYQRKKVILPTYPFQRQRYWASALEKKENLLFELNWQKIPSNQSGKIAFKGHWMIFSDENEWAQKLIQQSEITSTVVKIGSEIELQSDLEGILFFAPPKNNKIDFEQTHARLCEAVLSLMKKLTEKNLSIPIWFITQEAFSVMGEELNLLATPLNGLIKVINQEYSGISCTQIDVEEGVDPLQIAHQIIHGNEPLVAFRQGQKYVQRLDHLRKEKSKIAIQPKGCYLITGGLGALGLLFADYLLSEGATRIALVSRSKPSSQVEAKLELLRKKGKISLHSIDIANSSDVEKLLTTLHAETPIKGILHAAGVLEDALLRNQTREKFQKVFAPKVKGGWNLHQKTEELGIQLDFLIFFSSIASLFGTVGQSNYAAANSFLDGLASYRSVRGRPTLSINWGPWEESGMATRGDNLSILKRYLPAMQGLKTAQALSAFKMALSQLSPQVAIVPLASKDLHLMPPILQGLFENLAPRVEKIQKTLPAHGVLWNKIRSALPTERKNVVREFVREMLCHILGLPEETDIPVNKGFFDLGFDSLMAMELKNQLQNDLGNDFVLRETLAFDYSNISLLADYLQSLLEPAPAKEVQEVLKVGYEEEPIAIIGMGCRFPGSVTDPESFWRLLMEGKDPIKEIPKDRWNIDNYYSPDPNEPGKMITRFGGFLEGIDQFDAHFFGLSPREVETMDPQQRLVLESTWEALERAGYDPTSLNGSLTGVFVGVSFTDYLTRLVKSQSPEEIDAYLASGNVLSGVSGRLSYFLGLQGPCIAMDTACSSSLVAIHTACQSLRMKECNLALTGGVNIILSPEVNINLSRAHMLAPDGHCKTFDSKADGYVRSEGCGMIVLKRLEDAKRDKDPILAIIRGSAIHQDGSSGGLTVPNGSAQERLMRQVLASAKIKSEDVQYIETHGTGTSLGDPIEVRSIAEVYKRTENNPLILGAVKSNIGHAESAAGIAGLIKTILALQHQTIPKNLHFEKLNPKIHLEDIPAIVPKEHLPWNKDSKKRLAAISSFGFTGTIAHAILEEPPQMEQELNQIDRPLHLMTFSARDAKSLKDLLAKYVKELNPYEQLADIAFTANAGRAQFATRTAIVAHSTQELIEKIKEGDFKIHEVGSKSSKIAMLFTGQGSQYPNMGKELYESHPIFKEAFDRCAKSLSHEISLVELLFKGEETFHTGYAQLTLFAFEYALYELWRSWGIEPHYVMGHSIGEYVAAVVAGILTLQDALKLVGARARLMQSLPSGGAMAAILTDLETVQRSFKELLLDAEISAINGPKQIVISGRESEIQKACAHFEKQGIKALQLKVSHAFHSKLMEPILEEFSRIAYSVHHRPPTRGFISNVTGKLVGEESLDANYWIDHIRRPVLFYSSMQTLQNLGVKIYLEVGPHPILTGLASQYIPESTWLASLEHGKEDWKTVLTSLSELYMRGFSIDWKGFEAPYKRQKKILPTYPFQRKSYWALTTSDLIPDQKLKDRHPFLKQQINSKALAGGTLFETEIQEEWPNFIKDHKIYDVTVVAGATYLSTLFAAIKTLEGTKKYRIESIDFSNPLLIPDQETRQVQTIIYPFEKGKRKFEITSRPIEGDIWTLHVEGLISPLDSISYSKESIESLKAACPHKIEKGNFYQTVLSELGLGLKNHFQWIENLYVGKDQLLAELRPPKEEEKSGYVLHPGFIDSCFQTILGKIIEGEKEKVVAIPFSLKEFTFTEEKGIPRWVHGTYTQHGTIHVDLDLLNDKGEVIGRMADFAARAAPKEILLRSLSTKADLKKWFYEVQWKSQPLTGEVIPPQGKWLVFADSKGIANELSQKLSCTLTQATTKDEIKKLLELRPNGILYLSPLDDKELEFKSTERFLTLLQTIHEMGVVIPIWVVTNGLLQQALLAALRKVALIENRDLICKLITLDNLTNGSQFILKEISHSDHEDHVSYQHEERKVSRLVYSEIESKKELKIDSKGSYLITGGLVGLGLATAEWLASQGAKHLVLTGRRDPQESTLKVIEQMKQQGVTVVPLHHDISIEKDTKNLIEKFGKEFPELKGIIHAAGLIDDASLPNQDWKRFEKVMSPKVFGSWYLHEATKNKKIDFLIFYSSLASVVGSSGQSNYAAANAFLDALAEERRKEGLPALSISWGPWSQIGMAANLTQRLAGIGFIPMQPADALRALKVGIQLDKAHVMIANLNWKLISEQFEFTWLKEVMPLRTKKVEIATLLPKLKEAIPSKRKDILREHLRQLVGKILGLPETESIKDEQGFFDSGMDSIMALELKNQLQLDIGSIQKLPASLAFDYPTLAALDDYFAKVIYPLLGIVQEIPKEPLPKVAKEEKKEVLQEDEIERRLNEKFNKVKKAA